MANSLLAYNSVRRLGTTVARNGKLTQMYPLCIHTYLYISMLATSPVAGPPFARSSVARSPVDCSPVKFDDLECKPSNSMIWNADGQIRQFGVQTVKFNDLEC